MVSYFNFQRVHSGVPSIITSTYQVMGLYIFSGIRRSAMGIVLAEGASTCFEKLESYKYGWCHGNVIRLLIFIALFPLLLQIALSIETLKFNYPNKHA